jgi:hypothetical protein
MYLNIYNNKIITYLAAALTVLYNVGWSVCWSINNEFSV